MKGDFKTSDYQNIPTELKEMPQWVCFKLEPNEKKGKSDKMPYDPRTGYRAKANDPATWCDYETAAAAVERGDYDGIGFQFANGVFGVDLDHVVEDGGLTAEALDIMSMLSSYTEYSPSGTGVHILCKGTLPPGGCRRGFIEMYEKGRYFTVTGNVLFQLTKLNERTKEAAFIHAKYIARDKQFVAQYEDERRKAYEAFNARNELRERKEREEELERLAEHAIKQLSVSGNKFVQSLVNKINRGGRELEPAYRVITSLSMSNHELARQALVELSQREDAQVQQALKRIRKNINASMRGMVSLPKLSDNKPPRPTVTRQPLDGPAQRVTPISTLSDSELLQRAKGGKNGARFSALMDGDTTAYGGDHSRADQALINDLAYWSNGDAAQMDRIFRQSGLMRDKWDERRGRVTYGEMTITNALESFTPHIEKRALPEEAPMTTAQWSAALQAFVTPQSDASAPQFTCENPRPDAVGAYLDATFIKDVERFAGFKDRKTGFSVLDHYVGGLYPGLYVIGAISSLGKTTFIHQLGDQLAEAGDHVLYFSLEQSRLEMVTKSLSRITARRNRDTAVSAISIRGGRLTRAVLAAAEEYKNIADRVSVVECNFNVNINFILGYTRQYMAANAGVKPVVIVDYLQIIPPTDPRQSDKEKVDHIVRGLKKMQADNDLVVFVVSSINRSNYLTPIDFESFKESGGIEYTADVVWGLQLQILNDDLFNNKDTKIKEKREKVREAKTATPRKIELLCLKNRYGIASYSCGFIYTPQFDLFEEVSVFDNGAPLMSGPRL